MSSFVGLGLDLLHSILQRCPADPQGVPQDPPGSSVSAVCGRRPPDPLHRCCCCCCSPPSAPSAAATAAAAPLVTRRWLEIRVIISSLAGDCSVVVYVLVRTSRPRQCCLLVMLWRCDSQYREVSNPRFCYCMVRPLPEPSLFHCPLLSGNFVLNKRKAASLSYVSLWKPVYGSTSTRHLLWLSYDKLQSLNPCVWFDLYQVFIVTWCFRYSAKFHVNCVTSLLQPSCPPPRTQCVLPVLTSNPVDVISSSCRWLGFYILKSYIYIFFVHTWHQLL